jgi:sugar lactone lactonase YvrE
MKRNLSVLHFLFVILVFGLLTGCEKTAGVGTQDSGESAKMVMVSTLAGGEKGFADGIGSDARFSGPSGITIDASGNLYVADFFNHRIRKITPTGEVSTFAGDEKGFADSIKGDVGAFYYRSRGTGGVFHYRPNGIAIDAAGNLYVTDHHQSNRLTDHRIRKITPTGKASTLAKYDDGGLRFPPRIAIDAAGNLHIADVAPPLFNYYIGKITPTGEISGVGSAEESRAPSGIATDAAGNLYVAPSSIAIDAAGNLYVADFLNHRIRKITPAGEVSTFAGGEEGFADGVGDDAKFYGPEGITIDAAGNLYVADTVNNRIRKITPAGEVSTLAGGEEGFADGIGSDARFNAPSGIAIDAAGNLYVADSRNHRIRKIEIRRP